MRWFKDGLHPDGPVRKTNTLRAWPSLPGQPERKQVMQVQPYPALSIRTDPRNPNHHLWNNNGTWYLCVTVHTSAVTSERIRRSLGTADIQEARIKRDTYLNAGI